MRIFHIADTHLGFSQFNRLDPESGMNLREKQIYENFLAAIDEIILQKPDVLVHAGDLFDSVKPKNKAFSTAMEALERLHEAGIPLVSIAGNHSMVKTRYATSPFEVLVYHPGAFFAAYSFRYEKVELGDTVFHLIPNMLRPEDYRTAYDTVELSADHHNVLVTHGLATQIRDKRLATVAEHELDSTILSGEFDYIALGHYHRQSRITENAWYSGSLEYLSYGEISDPKGGLVIDLGRNSGRDHIEPTPIDLPRTPMIDLGTISCEGIPVSEITVEILSRIMDHDIPALSMAQVTLEDLTKGHGKRPDMRELSSVRERLLDLKIRVRSPEESGAVPPQQDLQSIDYIREFSAFLDSQQITPAQREYANRCGIRVLQTVMEKHREEQA